MDEAEYTKIMGLFESHLQVKKLSVPGTIRLYLHSVQMLVAFCDKFQQELVLPEKWKIRKCWCKRTGGISQVSDRCIALEKKYPGDLYQWYKGVLSIFG